MSRFRFSPKSLPLVFLLLSFVTYGLLIPWIGFYWDDWPFAWMAHFLGPAEFIAAFQPYRPFLGPIFFITTSLLGESPLAWQAFGVVMRFLITLAAWRSFAAIWPEHKSQALTTSLFMLVYPGYSQQWVAFTHINQELISFLAYVASFGLTAWAIRNPTRFFLGTALALILLVVGLVPTEYFIGLELLRWMVIWLLVAERTTGFRRRLWRSLRLWAPYFLIWVANAIWLGFYYKSGIYASYDLAAVGVFRETSWPAFLQLLRDTGEAIYKAGFYSWVQVFGTFSKSITSPITWLAIALSAACFLLIGFYLTRLELPGGRNGWAWQAIFLGLAGILLGRLPSWAAGLPLTLQSSYDRFMVSMMIGGSLLLTGLIELVMQSSRYKVHLISLVIALSIGQQFTNAGIFRRDWLRQQEIYWQFAWRIPALKPGTLLLTHQMPLDYETDLSMTAPLNWIYAPEFNPPELPYVLLYTEKRLGNPKLPDLKPGIAVTVPYRTVTFHGSTSAALVIYVPPHGCLRVLDPLYANRIVYEKYPRYLTEAIYLSDPSRIVTNTPSPMLPETPFGKEPYHAWCYYYEKAELARQVGNWEGAAALGRKALSQGHAPEDPYEWLPFIEAYAYTHDMATAAQTSRDALAAEPKLRKGLCLLWERVGKNAPEAAAQAASLLAEFGCAP